MAIPLPDLRSAGVQEAKRGAVIITYRGTERKLTCTITLSASRKTAPYEAQI